MTANKTRTFNPQYGRKLDDFEVGKTYFHPWEVTIDSGLLAVFAASFIDPNPLYSSRVHAQSLGFRDRVVHPLVLINLTIGYSVHDISEQAIAHLAYIDMRFPNACYEGDTLTAHSTVLDVRLTKSNPDRGIVHIRTVGTNQHGQPVIAFERKALIPSGSLTGRAHVETNGLPEAALEANSNSLSGDDTSLPAELSGSLPLGSRPGRLRGSFGDFEVGDIILHENGRTIGESEHMQLTMLSRNSHPLHFDEVYSKERSIAGTRVVCGPLVFAWVASLASRDTTANALWHLGFDNGSHPAPVLAGDTLFAASKVLEKSDSSEGAGSVRSRLVGVKNIHPRTLVGSGVDLFNDKFDQKVLDIERTVMLPKQHCPI